MVATKDLPKKAKAKVTNKQELARLREEAAARGITGNINVLPGDKIQKLIDAAKEADKEKKKNVSSNMLVKIHVYSCFRKRYIHRYTCTSASGTRYTEIHDKST
jgi:hypothetical protein